MATPEIKIYTKGGDKGYTSLMGGTRVPKYDNRIDAYGTIDELNSFIGLIRDFGIQNQYKEVILGIQNFLFTAESHLASETEASAQRLPVLQEEAIGILEKEIDRMNEHLPALKNFILPGGHPVVSYCHISRTICRRAERLVIKLAEEYDINPVIIRFLNRLSDYLFVLGRMLTQEFGAEEIAWNPHK
jgi:cob(I)alamin adenosyltransferase